MADVLGNEGLEPQKVKGRHLGPERLIELRRRWWPESFSLLRSIQETLGWTQAEMAAKLGYGTHQIWKKSRVEDIPNIKLLLVLCDVLQIPMSECVVGNISHSPLSPDYEKTIRTEAMQATQRQLLDLLFLQAAGDSIPLRPPVLRGAELQREGDRLALVLETSAGALRFKAELA